VPAERAHKWVRDRRLLLLLVKKKISPMPAAIYFFLNLTGEIFFFSILSSNFLPLPVLTHLIAIAVSGLWHGPRTAEH
jgi:hypothetical protein